MYRAIKNDIPPITKFVNQAKETKRTTTQKEDSDSQTAGKTK